MLLWLKDIPPDAPAANAEVKVLETDGEWAVVESPRPFPIGATLIAVERGETPSADYRIKVRGARRTESGFRIEGRWVSLEKHQRERLLEHAARSAR